MLTKKESKIIFWYISAWSLAGIIPFKVHGGKLERVSALRWILWMGFFAFSVLHTLHAIGQFIRLLINGIDSVPLHFGVIQLGFSYVPTVYLTVTFLAEVCSTGLLCQVFNELYTEGKQTFFKFFACLTFYLIQKIELNCMN